KDWYDRTEKPKIAARRREAEKERDRIRKAIRKECARCKKVLPRAAFNQHKGSLGGLQTYCRKCMADYQFEHYQNHPDKHAQRKQRQLDWKRNLSPQRKKAARLRALLRRHGLTRE